MLAAAVLWAVGGCCVVTGGVVEGIKVPGCGRLQSVTDKEWQNPRAQEETSLQAHTKHKHQTTQEPLSLSVSHLTKQQQKAPDQMSAAAPTQSEGLVEGVCFCFAAATQPAHLFTGSRGHTTNARPLLLLLLHTQGRKKSSMSLCRCRAIWTLLRLGQAKS